LRGKERSESLRYDGYKPVFPYSYYKPICNAVLSF
jgi:hypothetical protein